MFCAGYFIHIYILSEQFVNYKCYFRLRRPRRQYVVTFAIQFRKGNFATHVINGFLYKVTFAAEQFVTLTMQAA